MFESYTFIEAFGILLCLNVYERCAEMLNGCIDGIKHNLLAVAIAPFGGAIFQMSSLYLPFSVA